MEAWQNWFPFEFPNAHEIDDIIIDWLRPMELDERMGALSESEISLSQLRSQVKQQERELKFLSGTFECYETRM